MKLLNQRYSSNKKSTLGMLFDDTIIRKFLCYALEDPHQINKIPGKTRIPAGTYDIELRTVGGFNDRYARKFPNIHKGMLWVKDVPDFKYILIHIGNTVKDTDGCLLVGDGVNQNITVQGSISASTNAYKRIYPLIANPILSGEKVTIQYIDIA